VNNIDSYLDHVDRLTKICFPDDPICELAPEHADWFLSTQTAIPDDLDDKTIEKIAALDVQDEALRRAMVHIVLARQVGATERRRLTGETP
jgi:hypothetical protein